MLYRAIGVAYSGKSRTYERLFCESLTSTTRRLHYFLDKDVIMYLEYNIIYNIYYIASLFLDDLPSHGFFAKLSTSTAA